jgi:hypothetical protein
VEATFTTRPAATASFSSIKPTAAAERIASRKSIFIGSIRERLSVVALSGVGNHRHVERPTLYPVRDSSDEASADAPGLSILVYFPDARLVD